MFNIIITALVVLAFINRTSVIKMVMDFFTNTKTKATEVVATSKEQGARNTVHSLIDGLFDVTTKAATKASEVAESSKEAMQAKSKKIQEKLPKAPKQREFVFNKETGEMTFFITKEEDLVMGRNKKGMYAYSLSASGKETKLSQRGLERRLAYLQRAGKISEAQERAMKHFAQFTKSEQYQKAAK